MGGLVDVPLTHALYVVIEGVAVRAAGRSNFFWPELRKVGRAPVLHSPSVVSWGAILLKDVMAPIGHSVHPGLHNVTQDLDVLFCVNFQAFGKEVGGGMTSPLVAITMGTSVMSAQSHLLFFLFTF